MLKVLIYTLLAAARQNMIDDDATEVGNSVSFEQQLLGLICDPSILVKMCADCEPGCRWPHRLRAFACRLRASIRSELAALGTEQVMTRKRKPSRAPDDGLLAALRALHAAELRTFKGF